MICIILQSCISKSTVQKNENIDANTSYEISLLNDKLIHSIVTLDTVMLESLFSDQLKEKCENQLSSISRGIGSRFTKKTYKKLDEYNFINKIGDTTNFVASANGNDDNYLINYTSFKTENYISLLLVSDGKFILTAVYSKYFSGWKLNFIDFWPYSSYGKTAPELHKTAQEKYAKSHLIDALNDTYLSKKVLKPAPTVWKYEKEMEIQQFHEKLVAEYAAKYDFPIVLAKVATQPQIFYLNHTPFENKGIVPVIHYFSHISLTDTTVLKIENEKMKTEVNKLFVGINQNNKQLIYRVFNKIPQDIKQGVFFEMIDRIKQ